MQYRRCIHIHACGSRRPLAEFSSEHALAKRLFEGDTAHNKLGGRRAISEYPRLDDTPIYRPTYPRVRRCGVSVNELRDMPAKTAAAGPIEGGRINVLDRGTSCAPEDKLEITGIDEVISPLKYSLPRHAGRLQGTEPLSVYVILAADGGVDTAPNVLALQPGAAAEDVAAARVFARGDHAAQIASPGLKCPQVAQ